MHAIGSRGNPHGPTCSWAQKKLAALPLVNYIPRSMSLDADCEDIPQSKRKSEEGHANLAEETSRASKSPRLTETSPAQEPSTHLLTDLLQDMPQEEASEELAAPNSPVLETEDPGKLAAPDPADLVATTGPATPTWDSITIEQLLDWDEPRGTLPESLGTFNPLCSYETFLHWKKLVDEGLAQMAQSTLVGGPLDLDYCYRVLGDSQTSHQLKTGCLDQYGRLVPVTELPLPVLWKLVLQLPHRALEAFRRLKIAPCSSGAECLSLLICSKESWMRVLKAYVGEDLTLKEERVAMAYCLMETIQSALETIHSQNNLARYPDRADLVCRQSLALQVLWSDFWHKLPVLQETTLKKWKQYKPRDLAKLEPMTMAKLEAELRKRWLEKLVSVFVPYREHVPNLQALSKSLDFYKEAQDLFGDAQWRTLRTHCNRLLSVLSIKYGKHRPEEAGSSKGVQPCLPGGRNSILAIPWTSHQIRDLMSELEDQQATPAKIEGVWGTLKYLSKIFGLLDPEDFSALSKKKDALMDRLVPAVTQEVQQATIPSASMLVSIEEAIATGHDPHGNPIPSGCIWMLIILRLLTGASARWSDLMHTSPGSFVDSPEALEFLPWRTKTVKKSKRKKKQTILIIPKVCFSEFCEGKRKYDWVPVALEYMTFFKTNPAFQDMDYMFPAVTKDLKAFIPRPCSDSMALRIIHDSLQRAGVPRQKALEMSFHGWRALINEWGFQQMIPKSTRTFLGNWGSEEMTDTYTRQKRQVVQEIWQQVLTGVRDNPRGTDTSCRTLIADPAHKSWDDSNLGKAWQSPEQQQHKEDAPRVEASSSEPGVSKTTSSLLGLKDPEDPSLGSPLNVFVALRNSGTKAYPQFKVHLLDETGLEIGNGWRPEFDKIQPLTKEDWAQEPEKYKFCGNCFKCYSLPGSWTSDEQETQVLAPSTPGLAEESGSEEASNDTASETEAVAPGPPA